jgi:hypothetical protein
VVSKTNGQTLREIMSGLRPFVEWISCPAAGVKTDVRFAGRPTIPDLNDPGGQFTIRACPRLPGRSYCNQHQPSVLSYC